MRDPAFTAPGRFWKGNLHTHSDRSDGALSPEEVCRRYRAEGYDFLALTDHLIGLYDYPIVDTTGFRTDGFTTILGAEIHSGAMANGELWHILAVGLPPDFAPPDAPDFHARPDQESGPALAARARDAGASSPSPIPNGRSCRKPTQPASTPPMPSRSTTTVAPWAPTAPTASTRSTGC